MGSGLAMVGVDLSRPAGEEAVRAVFGRLQHPETGESLGRAPRRFKTYHQRLKVAVEREALPTPERLRELELAAKTDGRKAVAYYDFTFSPVKSVSVYYAALLAAGLTGEAELVVAAHRDAVDIAMAYAEKQIGYTRVGYHGKTEDGRSVGRYEATDGLVMTGWEHSTNREGEPQLHTHVAVLNRATTSSDGRIRALDGRGFRPIKEAIATIYERGIERGLRESLGVAFATRPDGMAREILGVDPELCAAASTRRAQVLDRLGDLITEYEQRHGRSPDAAARKAMAQAATLDTRAAKHGRPAGPAAVLAWGLERGRVMAATVNNVAAAANGVAVHGHPDTALRPAAGDRTAMLAAAVAEVQARYASWTVGT
jgi:conjugative relaxase-like TrwC/TraI family protein